MQGRIWSAYRVLQTLPLTLALAHTPAAYPHSAARFPLYLAGLLHSPDAVAHTLTCFQGFVEGGNAEGGQDEGDGSLPTAGARVLLSQPGLHALSGPGSGSVFRVRRCLHGLPWLLHTHWLAVGAAVSSVAACAGLACACAAWGMLRPRLLPGAGRGFGVPPPWKWGGRSGGSSGGDVWPLQQESVVAAARGAPGSGKESGQQQAGSWRVRPRPRLRPPPPLSLRSMREQEEEDSGEQSAGAGRGGIAGREAAPALPPAGEVLHGATHRPPSVETGLMASIAAANTALGGAGGGT